MEVAFAVEDLTTMKRTELQKLCKSVGIKANSKVGKQPARIFSYPVIHCKVNYHKFFAADRPLN